MKFLLITLLITLLLTVSVSAQISGSGTKHFEKYGLEFEYPAAWKMTEGSADDLQYVELAADTKTVQLIIYRQYGSVLECQFEATRKQITRALADRVATQIHTTPPPENSLLESHFGNLPADEIQLRGLINNNPVTADVYSLVVKNYFLNLVYLRADHDASGNSAWEAIRTTLKLAPPVPLTKGKKPINGGVLNGKAIRLPRPSYPAQARAAHVGGTVEVQVLIDELGNVIETCVLLGDPLLRNVSEEAARQAKFTSTKLSGKPVRVTGIIQYNFVSSTGFP